MGNGVTLVGARQKERPNGFVAVAVTAEVVVLARTSHLALQFQEAIKEAVML